MPLIHREPPRGTRTNPFGNERIASAPSQNSGSELGGLRRAEIGRQKERGAEDVPPGQQRLRVTPWDRLLCLAATRIPFSFLGARLRSHGWLGCGFEPCPMMIGRRWLADHNAGPHPSGTHDLHQKIAASDAEGTSPSTMIPLRYARSIPPGSCEYDADAYPAVFMTASGDADGGAKKKKKRLRFGPSKGGSGTR